MQGRHHVGLSPCEWRFAHKMAAGWRGGGCWYWALGVLDETKLTKQLFDRVLLPVLCVIAPKSFNLPGRHERGRGDHSRRPLFRQGVASFDHPREAVRIENPKHDVAQARGLIGIAAQRPGGKRCFGQRLEIIFGDRRGRQVAEGPPVVFVAHEVRDHVRVELGRLQLWNAVDEAREDTGESREMLRVKL